jgi:hypothetical protein
MTSGSAEWIKSSMLAVQVAIVVVLVVAVAIVVEVVVEGTEGDKRNEEEDGEEGVGIASLDGLVGGVKEVMIEDIDEASRDPIAFASPHSSAVAVAGAGVGGAVRGLAKSSAKAARVGLTRAALYR